MPRRKMSFDLVREIGVELPDIRDATTNRGVALKLHGKLLACKAINKSAEANSLMVRMSLDERERLIATAPDTFYLTDHYRSTPCILVRLDRITQKALRQALQSGWRFMMERT